MKYLRLLLFPFSLVYWLVVVIRNWLYDTGIFKSRLFTIPIIMVGNLEIGGAGKSPMTEYLIRLLKTDYRLATLSRGYGRDTKGYLIADATTNANQIGDEPTQFKQKFPDVSVAVCEDRVLGIQRLQADHNLILLDDAYQHRAVKPGLSILLFDYSTIDQPKLLLPTGNLREPFSGRWRADIIVVTKCPDDLNQQKQDDIGAVIKPLPYQQLFFSTISYFGLQYMDGKPYDGLIDPNTAVFLLTGIANSRPLVQHLEKYTSDIIHHKYPDHHQFTLKNISKLAGDFEACASEKKVIITTEKDVQRLRVQELLPLVNKLPVLVIPIGIKFLNDEGENFDRSIEKHVREYTEHRQLH
jgi:tetraacyldisaccharide 4'-kinase